MRLKARIWTPEPSSNCQAVDVDLNEVIENTELPIPVLVEFDQEQEIGKVVELFIKDGCLDGVLELNEPMEKVLTRFGEDKRTGVKPTVCWRVVDDLLPDNPEIWTAKNLLSMGLSADPAVPGTYIEGLIKEITWHNSFWSKLLMWVRSKLR